MFRKIKLYITEKVIFKIFGKYIKNPRAQPVDSIDIMFTAIRMDSRLDMAMMQADCILYLRYQAFYMLQRILFQHV